jgi:hypothetical protein
MLREQDAGDVRPGLGLSHLEANAPRLPLPKLIQRHVSGPCRIVEPRSRVPLHETGSVERIPSSGRLFLAVLDKLAQR